MFPSDDGTGSSAISREVYRRRTFAIISHPDAGKTTLTEKLLLYAGAVNLAGAVHARKTQRHATSDWLAIERERGISVTSTVLQFEYHGYRLNLLDTPGHQDFSEDTYRTLMAVDSAVMVLDAAKGIEPQTEKLFQVCRLRRLPILTFINKMDHPGRDPFELLDEIERVLGIRAVPKNWPVGDGPAFQGVYDLDACQVLRYERTEHDQRRAPVLRGSATDPALAAYLGSTAHRRLREEVELLEVAGATFDRDQFLAGEITPVFFGSALHNFGIEPFLDALLALAPAPGTRASSRGPIMPTEPNFSGFIFKIQANMDPQHRDRMAFLRVCSGRFRKDMVVHHDRLGRRIRLTRPHRLFARERETVTEAFAGDVVGLLNPGLFAIGDTISSGESLRFDAVPRFSPECFATVRNRDISRYKQFHKGIAQLEEEGAVQLLVRTDTTRHEQILATVGELQFDVVRARLRTEYGVEIELDRLPMTCARWVTGDPVAVAAVFWPSWGVVRARDRNDHLVALFASARDLAAYQERNPGLELRQLGGELAPVGPGDLYSARSGG